MGKNMSNWQKVKIGDFLFERKGRYKPNDEQIVNLPRIEKIDFGGNFHIGNKDSKTDMILIKDGDLVISGINVAKGAIGIYSGEDVTATIHYSSYTFDSNKINVEYFKRFLKSSEFIELLNEQVKGGIKTEIKPKHILPLEIQLPDINTQAQIVQHFENVEDDIADVTKEVLKQESLLKKLKQTILQEAIEGKLTAKYRAKNPDIGTAKELLDQIKTEKEQLVKDKKIKVHDQERSENADEDRSRTWFYR
jgi:type I restriction enzyme S subunit